MQSLWTLVEIGLIGVAELGLATVVLTTVVSSFCA